MSWPALAFTHSGGGLRIRWWVEGIRDAGFLPVVIDDANDPLPGTALGWLEAEGVEYLATSWPRRGNLNGTDTAGWICLEMAEACLRHGTPMALKVDDDTVIVDPDLFTGWPHAEAIGVTWAGDARGGDCYGMAYALSADLAAEIAANLGRLPVDVTAPEDRAVWCAAVALAGPAGVVRHEFERDAGPFAALPWGSCPRDAVERYGIVTVGNPPPEEWTDRPRQTAALMRQVVCAARAAVARSGCE